MDIQKTYKGELGYMSKLYVNQPINIILTLRVSTGDFTTATTGRINYKKADQTTGFWPGTITSTGRLTYNASSTEIDQSGTWRLQPVVTFSDGKVIPGETVLMDISPRYK